MAHASDTLGALVDQAKLLTPAEREILELVARGLSNKRLALVRGVSTSTVANQISAAYRKMHVTGRRELKARLCAEPPSSAGTLSPALTPREKQILAFVDRGESNKVIAISLGVSISTVSTTLTRARRKCRHPDNGNRDA